METVNRLIPESKGWTDKFDKRFTNTEASASFFHGTLCVERRLTRTRVNSQKENIHKIHLETTTKKEIQKRRIEKLGNEVNSVKKCE